MKLNKSEILENNSIEECLAGPSGIRIDDIDLSVRGENLELSPLPCGENAVGKIPFQYWPLDQDWDVPNKRACKKWTEELEVYIGAWDEVEGLFSDVLAVRLKRGSADYSHRQSFPSEPESAREGGVPKSYLRRIKRTFGEVKDLFKVFGCQSWPAQKTCLSRNA